MLFFLGISLPLVISAAGKIFINRTSAEHIIVPGRAATDSDARRAVVSTVYAQEPDDGNSKKKKYKPTRKVKFVPVGPNAGTYCDPYTRHYYPNLCPTPEQQQGEIPKAEWDPKSFPSSAGPTAYPGGPQITGLEHLRHGDMEEHMRSIKTKWLGPGLGQIFMSNLVESSMDLLNPKGAGGLLSSVTSGLVGAVAKGVGLESGKMVDAFVDNAGSFGGFVFNQLLSSLDPDNLLPAIGGGNIRDRLGSLFDSFFGPLDSEGNYDSLRERGVQVMMALMQKGAQAGIETLSDREGLTKSIKGVAGPMLLKLAKSALSGKGKGGSESFLQTAVGRTGRYLRRREQTAAASVLAPSFMQMDMYHHQYQYPGQVGPSQLTKQKPTQFPNQLPEPKGGGGFPAAYGYFWPSGSPYGAYSQSGYDPKTGIPYDLGYAYQYAVLKPGDRPDLTGIHPGEEGTKTTKSRAGRFAAAAAKWTGGGDGLMGGLTKGLGKIAGGRMQGVVQSLASDFAGDLLSQTGVDQFGSLLGGMTDSFMGHLEAVVSPDGLAGHASEQIKSTMIGLAEADMAKDNAFPAFQDTLSSVLVGFGRSLAQNHFGEEGGNMATILTEKVPQLLRSVLKDTKA